MSIQATGKVEVSKFKWEINLDCFKSKAVGEPLISPIFFTENSDECKYEWELELYPKGRTENNSYISIYLHNLTSGKVIHTVVTFSILSSDDSVAFVAGPFSNVFTNFGYWGLLRWIHESLIIDHNNIVSRDEKFTIMCKIITSKNEVMLQQAETEDKKNSFSLNQFGRYEDLLNNKELSDITVTAEGKNFYLHKCILRSSCDVFDVMLKNDMKEKNQNLVEIEDIKYDILQELFRFIYSGKVNNIETIAGELLTAAEKYGVQDLKALCEETISTILSKDNVIDYLNLAIMNNSEKCKLNAIDLISLHLECLIENPEFEEFGKKHPEELFKILKKRAVF